MEWWAQDKYKIGNLEIEDYGITSIYARLVNGEWEYALTFWRYGSPSLRCVMKGGKILC